MPAGRPPKYETKEEMQRIIDLYFLACRAHQDGDASRLCDCNDDDLLVINEIEDVVPTVSGLAYTLGMSRQALIDYEGKEEFLDTVKRAKQRIEMSLEQRLAGNNVTGSIFNLKNNFGWKDKQEVDLTKKTKVEEMTDEELDEFIASRT
jgi:hypothetical protein